MNQRWGGRGGKTSGLTLGAFGVSTGRKTVRTTSQQRLDMPCQSLSPASGGMVKPPTTVVPLQFSHCCLA